MAKGIGLIGNFRGKVGNMVGYNLKDSNNKQTQGVRVYQPVVKNPKTSGQAEQRAKLAPINATYRALKAIIDRGQEGKAYGNKSRLAWLSEAIKSFNGGWFDKGVAITAPALIPLTKGSLAGLPQPQASDSTLKLTITGYSESSPANMGEFSRAIIAAHPTIQNGDQISFVLIGTSDGSLVSKVVSILIDTTSTESVPDNFEFDGNNATVYDSNITTEAGAIIVSREGDNGQHLRSTTSVAKMTAYPAAVMDDAAKEAAIKSYMSAGANTDWAEESLQ